MYSKKHSQYLYLIPHVSMNLFIKIIDKILQKACHKPCAINKL